MKILQKQDNCCQQAVQQERERVLPIILDVLRDRKRFRYWWDDLSEDEEKDIEICIKEALTTDEGKEAG